MTSAWLRLCALIVSPCWCEAATLLRSENPRFPTSDLRERQGAVHVPHALLAESSHVDADAGSLDAIRLLSARVPPGGHTIVISLRKHAERAARLRKEFSSIGMDFVDMEAVDASSADREALYSACGFEAWQGALTKEGRAIAASHKKALQLAAERQEDWTLILEDDVALLPVPAENWLAGFDAAWKRLQNRDVAVVRLGWCEFEKGMPEIEPLGHGFQLVHRIRYSHNKEAPYGINDGACTTGYIVHKKYLREMIKAFAGCHEPVDLFYGHELFNKPPFADKVWSITHENATTMFKGWRPMEQHGLIAQRHEG